MKWAQDLTFWYTGEKCSHRDLSAIALFFKHIHWLPDSSTAFLFSFCLVKMALLSPFFVANTEGKTRKTTTVRCCILEHLKAVWGKNGKLRLCKHMEKNELLMHLVSFIYILPSVPNGLPGLWTPDDSVALCQGVFFLEPELDYASISKWQIKNGKLNPAVRICCLHQFRAG